jgi:hypothetical protein
VVLDADTRAALQQRFADCLCRACLEAAAHGGIDSISREAARE